MATRKNTPPRPPPSDATFTAVLEDLRAQFRVFGEAVQGVDQKVQRVTDELHEFRHEVDRRFDQVDLRFARVERAILDHGREIKPLRSGLEDVRDEVGEVRATVTRIETALASKVSRDEVESIVGLALARR